MYQYENHKKRERTAEKIGSSRSEVIDKIEFWSCLYCVESVCITCGSEQDTSYKIIYTKMCIWCKTMCLIPQSTCDFSCINPKNTMVWIFWIQYSVTKDRKMWWIKWLIQKHMNNCSFLFRQEIRIQPYLHVHIKMQ
jgi:hypothetical protein